MVEPHLAILHTVAETVSRTLNVDDVLRTAVEALTRVTGHEIASLHLLSDDGKTLHLRGERGMSPTLREVNQTLPVGEGLIGRVAATGRTVRVEKNYADPDLLPAARAAVQREHIRGFVCVPIHSRGRILGTLSLGRKTLDELSRYGAERAREMGLDQLSEDDQMDYVNRAIKESRNENRNR